MVRLFAVLFGIIFIFVGVLGFLSIYMVDDLLFGYLDAGFMHNVVNILTGVIAIMSATSYGLAKLFFKVFGVIYLALGIWGFWSGGDLYIMQVKFADNVVNLIVGFVALCVGFGMGKKNQ